MGQYDITGKYPCIVRRENQLEYAIYNYVNAAVMLKELACLCASPMRGDMRIRRAITTILCEIGIIAKENGDDFCYKISEAAGLSFVAGNDWTWRFLGQRISRIVAFLEHKCTKDVPFPSKNRNIPILRKDFGITNGDDCSKCVYENRRHELEEALRLIRTPIPYYHFCDALHDSIAIIANHSPYLEFRKHLESALSGFPTRDKATEKDMFAFEQHITSALQNLR